MKHFNVYSCSFYIAYMFCLHFFIDQTDVAHKCWNISIFYIYISSYSKFKKNLFNVMIKCLEAKFCKYCKLYFLESILNSFRKYNPPFRHETKKKIQLRLDAAALATQLSHSPNLTQLIWRYQSNSFYHNKDHS